jgi:hypothetical protein
MLSEKTLDQILGVLELTSKYCKAGLPTAKAYQKSVKDIAHKYSVRYQTIADGCRRRLNLDNVNEFMELLTEWLSGNPAPLKDLLVKNIDQMDEYKVENFFDHKLVTTSTKTESERKVEDSFEVITVKAPRNIVSQLRALAESEDKSLQDLINIIVKQYVDQHYVEYVRKLINSLPPGRKETILKELSNS